MTDSPLFSNLRNVITIIDRLRDIGLSKYISLPRIAVLGTQSSGKSSLLEQIVGLDFLPRGNVTSRYIFHKFTTEFIKINYNYAGKFFHLIFV